MKEPPITKSNTPGSLRPGADFGGGPAECAGRAEALELCQDLGFLSDTLCPPERGRRI